MAIYLFEKRTLDSGSSYKMISEVPIAGHNLIYNTWLNKGKPINAGWEITENDILENFKNAASVNSCPALIIDFDPKGKEEITLLEMVHIYAYTYADKTTEEIWWTPILPKMYEIKPKKHFSKCKSPRERKAIISEFESTGYGNEIVEFLYLQGEKHGWNWGMVGRVNGALIYSDARKYFKPYI